LSYDETLKVSPTNDVKPWKVPHNTNLPHGSWLDVTKLNQTLPNTIKHIRGWPLSQSDGFKPSVKLFDDVLRNKILTSKVPTSLYDWIWVPFGCVCEF